MKSAAPNLVGMLFVFFYIPITIHYFLSVIDDHMNISDDSILHDGSSDSFSSEGDGEDDGGIMSNMEFDMFFVCRRCTYW